MKYQTYYLNLLVRLRFLCHRPIPAPLFPPFPTSLPCRVFPFRCAWIARLRICAVMLHYIYRHRMANACSGTVPVLSLMPVHDWSEDYASSVSSPVINRIPVSFGLSLRPTSFPTLPDFFCHAVSFHSVLHGVARLRICAVMLHYIFAPSCFTTFIDTAWQTLAAGRCPSFL